MKTTVHPSTTYEAHGQAIVMSSRQCNQLTQQWIEVI
jgi:hypothetical protein